MSANKNRADDQTVLGVSMPKTLKERIARIADSDQRPMAQWAKIQLEKIVSEWEGSQVERPKSKPLKSLPDQNPNTKRQSQK